MMSNQFTPENSALVLVDYQVETLQLIRNNSSGQSLRNAVMLAKGGMPYGMPIGPDYKLGGSYSRAARSSAAACIA